MKNIAVIPLRTKSARLKDKNFFDISGVPLFGISAQIAKESKVFSEVIIAIDRPEMISDYCKANKLKIFERSKKSASSSASTEEVLMEIIKSKKYNSDWLTIIQATCPFQQVHYFKELKKKIGQKNYNSVITRIKFKRFFIDQVIKKSFRRERTQDMKLDYLETGLFWSFKISEFLTIKNRIINPVGFIDIKKGDDLDIDDEEDLKLALPRLKNFIE